MKFMPSTTWARACRIDAGFQALESSGSMRSLGNLQRHRETDSLIQQLVEPLPVLMSDLLLFTKPGNALRWHLFVSQSLLNLLLSKNICLN